jgi:hypothetical protein
MYGRHGELCLWIDGSCHCLASKHRSRHESFFFLSRVDYLIRRLSSDTRTAYQPANYRINQPNHAGWDHIFSPISLLALLLVHLHCIASFVLHELHRLRALSHQARQPEQRTRPANTARVDRPAQHSQQSRYARWESDGSFFESS